MFSKWVNGFKAWWLAKKHKWRMVAEAGYNVGYGLSEKYYEKGVEPVMKKTGLDKVDSWLEKKRKGNGKSTADGT